MNGAFISGEVKNNGDNEINYCSDEIGYCSGDIRNNGGVC